jgi:hypothetical protein
VTRAGVCGPSVATVGSGSGGVGAAAGTSGSFKRSGSARRFPTTEAASATSAERPQPLVTVAHTRPPDASTSSVAGTRKRVGTCAPLAAAQTPKPCKTRMSITQRHVTLFDHRRPIRGSHHPNGMIAAFRHPDASVPAIDTGRASPGRRGPSGAVCSPCGRFLQRGPGQREHTWKGAEARRGQRRAEPCCRCCQAGAALPTAGRTSHARPRRPPWMPRRVGAS